MHSCNITILHELLQCISKHTTLFDQTNLFRDTVWATLQWKSSVLRMDAGYIWMVAGVRGWGLAAGPLYSPSPAPHSINNFEHVKWASHQPPARPAPARHSTGRRSQDTAEQHTGHCGPRGHWHWQGDYRWPLEETLVQASR